jgi:Ca2+-binding EF-hand superfamily protein
LRKLIETEGKDYSKTEDFDFLFSLLKASTVANSYGKITEKDKMIGRQEWINVMNAWSAFSASDINNDNSVNVVELKTLIWIYEGEEPNDHRVQNEMKEIDADKSGFIDRFEWVKNFCAPDKNGKIVFRSNIKALFEKYDKDNSGYLTMDEIQGLMREAFKEYTTRCKDAETKQRLLEMIDGLTKEIFTELDDSGDKSLNWPEFRHFVEVSIGKQEKLKKFLDTTL